MSGHAIAARGSLFDGRKLDASLSVADGRLGWCWWGRPEGKPMLVCPVGFGEAQRHMQRESELEGTQRHCLTIAALLEQR